MKNYQIIVIIIFTITAVFCIGYFFGERSETASCSGGLESKIMSTESISPTSGCGESVESLMTRLNKEANPDLVQNIPDEYGVYVSYVDSICPSVTTVSTQECMDAQIEIQRARYNHLASLVVGVAQKLSNELTAKDEPVDLETLGILQSIPDYTKVREDYVQKLCALRTFSTTGTGIGEEIRTCFMYYNSKDIEQLERIKASGYE